MLIDNRPSPVPLVESIPSTQAASSVASSALCRLDEISRLVETLVAAWYDAPLVQQQRGKHRIPFDQPLALTPLDDKTEEFIGQPQIVAGRNLSLDGVSFSHEQPMPFRKIALTFALPDGEVESMVTRLRWCRFTRDGLYQSGGTFLRTIRSPIGSDVDWMLLPRA